MCERMCCGGMDVEGVSVNKGAGCVNACVVEGWVLRV